MDHISLLQISFNFIKINFLVGNGSHKLMIKILYDRLFTAYIKQTKHSNVALSNAEVIKSRIYCETKDSSLRDTSIKCHRACEILKIIAEKIFKNKHFIGKRIVIIESSSLGWI